MTASIFRVGFDELDRAATDRATGFIKVAAQRGAMTSATVVGPHAGEVIGALSLAMRNRLTLQTNRGHRLPVPDLYRGTEEGRRPVQPHPADAVPGASAKTWLKWFR